MANDEHFIDICRRGRLYADCKELYHCVHGVDILWRHLDGAELLHSYSDVKGLKFGVPLTSSGTLPCLVANLGSALTIVQVGHGFLYIVRGRGRAVGKPNAFIYLILVYA